MSSGVGLNVHRGLGHDEPGRSYRRFRLSAQADELAPEDEDYDGYELEDWNHPSGWSADELVLLANWEETLFAAKTRRTIADVLPADLREALACGRDPFAPAVVPGVDAGELPRTLHAHVEALVEDGAIAFAQRAQFREALWAINGGYAGIERALRVFAGRPAPVVMSLLFAPFWARPIATWAPPETGDTNTLVRSLVEHLFAVHAIPSPLFRPWFREEGLPELKWTCWLVLFGRGVSLHRAAKVFDWGVSKKLSHHFVAAPEHLGAAEACLFAEIARLGGTRVELERILRNEAYVMDPTDAGADAAFLRDTVLWLVRHRDRLTDRECDRVLEWAMHLHTEARYRRPSFRWTGRTPEACLLAADAYLRDRWSYHDHLEWQGRGWDATVEDGAGTSWTFTELTTSEALREEGLALGHCVGGYAYRCAGGMSAIFSVRAGGLRTLTLELNPSSKRIIQVRGRRNRAASTEEMRVVERWVDTAPQGRTNCAEGTTPSGVAFGGIATT